MSLPSYMGRERGMDWPPIGHYGLGNKPIAFSSAPDVERIAVPPSRFKNLPSNPKTVTEFAEGGPVIYLERYVDRNYGFSISYIGFRFPIAAHWLEKMGNGAYGMRQSFDLWNPGSAFPPAPSDHKAFHFYRIFIATSEEQYHEELRSWLADQHGVWSSIVRGMREKNIITEEQARRPLRIKMFGVDLRRKSLERQNPPTPQKPSITQAPFADIVPEGTVIAWEDRYAN
jgi:hypothetical protein